MKDKLVKKIILLLVVFILSFPVFSSITYDRTVPEELKTRIDSAYEKARGDRRDLDITISDANVDNKILSCSISYDGKSVAFVSPLEYLEEEIDSLFFYEESLFESGERLDYVYKKSFSSITLENAKRGDNYRLIGHSGRTEGLFQVDEIYSEAVLLKPYFLSSSVLPGMRLDKINDFSVYLRFFSTLKFNKVGVSFSFSSSSILYPLSPFIGGAIIKDSSSQAIFMLIGISGRFNFSTYFPQVPVIKNLALRGEASIGGRYNSNFALSAEASLELVYTFSRVMSISLGVVNYDGDYYYSLTLGGKL